MNDVLSVHGIRREARLLFALLDAYANGAKRPGIALDPQWSEAKKRIERSGDYEAEAVVIYEMLASLAAGGNLAGTWIERRWRDVQSRMADEG